MVQGVDGALVGFASLIPDFLVDLYEAVCDGDLHAAQQIQRRISILKDAVYADEEPSGDAHARMKAGDGDGGPPEVFRGQASDETALARAP